MRYLKRKSDPDHIYHVWMPELAKREDMVEFFVEELEPATMQNESIVEHVPVVLNTTVGRFSAKSVGFGNFKVIDGAGEFVTGKMTKDEAEKEAARLNGEA